MRFATLFARLRSEALGNYSLAFRAHDVRLALNVAARLHPRARLGAIRRRAWRAAVAANRLRTEALGEALDLALAGAAAPELRMDEPSPREVPLADASHPAPNSASLSEPVT